MFFVLHWNPEKTDHSAELFRLSWQQSSQFITLHESYGYGSVEAESYILPSWISIIGFGSAKGILIQVFFCFLCFLTHFSFCFPWTWSRCNHAEFWLSRNVEARWGPNNDSFVCVRHSLFDCVRLHLSPPICLPLSSSWVFVWVLLSIVEQFLRVCFRPQNNRKPFADPEPEMKP